MDHLPYISNASSHLPRVPWLMDEYFLNNENLARLPDLCKDKLIDDLQASAIFQQRVFFGLLIEVLAIHEIRVQLEDFCSNTDTEKFLTTNLLWDYLAAWIANASRQSSLVLENRAEFHWRDADEIQRGQAIEAAMRSRKILQKYSSLFQALLPCRFSITASVWDSALVLFSTLENMIVNAYRTLEVISSTAIESSLLRRIPSRLLPELQSMQGWCPNQGHAIITNFENSLPILLSCVRLKTHPTDAKHVACRTGKCNAYQVDNTRYVTKHILSECSCPFLSAGNVYNDSLYGTKNFFLSKIGEKIPAVIYENGGLQVVPVAPLDAEAARLVRPFMNIQANFVAFSHVWAQGRGNPHSNALYRCQIEQLQTLANRLYPQATKPVPFWIDTLCIPLDPLTRKLGIQSMERIYKSAPTILVLDDDLMQTYSRGLSPEEIALRIARSAWAGRLWTLQEGLFQKRVFYRFADAIQSFSSLNDAVRQMHNFQSRSRSIPKGHFLHRTLDYAPNCGDLGTGTLRRNAHKALSFWPQISAFFKRIDIMSSWEIIDTETSLVQIMRSMLTRTTSNVEDESLVFASATTRFAGSARELLEIEPSERYRRIFIPKYGIKRITGYLIFLDQRRYHEFGCRWIPRSLLSQESASTDVAYIPQSGEGALAYATGGIGVRYPGIMIVRSDVNQYFPSQFVIFHQDEDGKIHDHVGEVYEAGTHNTISNLVLQHPAIILPRKEALEDRKGTAVLVEILNWSEVLRECTMNDEQTMMTMKNTINPMKYSKFGQFHIHARHEALVRLLSISGQEEILSYLPKLRTQTILRKSRYPVKAFADTLPNWLVL